MIARERSEEPAPARTLNLQDQLALLSSDLATLLKREKARTRELDNALRTLREAYIATARALALIVEGRDPETRTHLDRTQRWASAVARRLAVPDLEDLQLGFLLHDIGKWAVPQHIIQKPGKLTEAEWRIMRTHPVAGAQMVSDVPFLSKAAEVIRGHHEKWDGTGYPYGLAGDRIPVGARVFCVADVFDALTSDRPYRAALSVPEAAAMIRAEKARHFDPEVVDVFLQIVEEVIEVGGTNAEPVPPQDTLGGESAVFPPPAP